MSRRGCSRPARAKASALPTTIGSAYRGVERVGSEWVYTLQRTGTLHDEHPHNSPDDLGFTVRSSSA